MIAFLNLAAQQVRHELLAIADAEDGESRDVEHAASMWGCRVRRRCGATGDDDSLRPEQFEAGVSLGANLGVDTQVTHFAGDQMAILAACVRELES